MKTSPCHALALLLAGAALASAQDGSNRVIATSGTAAPAGGNFASFLNPVLNNSGMVSFWAQSAVEAIYETSGNSLLTIAAGAQTAPGLGAAFANFSSPVLNESGTVAFIGTITDGLTKGIYTGTGGALTTVSAFGQSLPGLPGTISGYSPTVALGDNGGVAFRATANILAVTADGEFWSTGAAVATTVQIAPGGGGIFTSFTAPVVNNTGSSVFQAQASTLAGVFTAFGSTLATVATTAQVAPDLGTNFTSFSTISAINDSGAVAFLGFSGSRIGIFQRVNGVLSAVATSNTLAPGFTKNFISFTEPALSNSGKVAFEGALSGGRGIYTSTGGALTTVAKTGDIAPTLGSAFTRFGSFPGTKPAVNDLGTVAFYGEAGSSSGLFLGDGQQLVTVAFTGESLAGSTVSSFNFTGGADRGGSGQLNNNGQLVYTASLASGGSTIQLFTPTLHFRSAASGAWGARANWTLGLAPAAVHDVVIDPAAALAITGPTLPTTVKSLAITGSGELTLQSAGTITAAGGASTGAAGRLSGSGRLIANLTSAGTIAPGLAASAGAISITGNVTLQSTAHLAFDLGGLTRKTGYDFLGVSGALTLGGSLDVSLLGAFAPQAGNSFDLFDATSIAGSFAAIHLPALTGGLTWNTTQLPTTGIISIAGLTVAPASYTLAALTGAATIHAGGTASITATITHTGAAGTDTLNFTGLSVQASGGSITPLALSGLALASSAAQSGTATFSSATAGTYTLTPTVASALNATLGTAATNAGVTPASVGVFSGSAKWNAASGSAWGAGASANWTDTAAASVHAAPGTFAGFAAADSAVFDATGGSLVNLDGATPSLAALTFTGGSHTLAAGTGGTLTLNGGASPATLTDSAGSHSITAPVLLGSDTTAAVTNAADTLTLSGGLTGVGKTLTKTGAGKLILSGAQNYAALNLNGGHTEIAGSATGGTAIVHANASVTFEASQSFAALFIGDGVTVTFGNGGSSAFDDAALKSATAAVPEPAAASLLLLTALGTLARRYRPSSSRRN